MQLATRQHTLNVEESDRLSFLPYMFGNDFMLAELQIYALAGRRRIHDARLRSGTHDQR